MLLPCHSYAYCASTLTQAHALPGLPTWRDRRTGTVRGVGVEIGSSVWPDFGFRVAHSTSSRHSPFFCSPYALYIRSSGLAKAHTVFCTPHRHREGGR